MNAIVNTKLILEDGILWDGVLLHENGRIVALGSADEIQVPKGAEILDAQGLYTAPGLIDIHNHGGGKAGFHEDPLACAEHFLRHGQTTVLPTLYFDLTMEEMVEAVARIQAANQHGAGRILDGLYMEGPYMGGFGGDQKYIKWQGEICQAEYAPLVEAIGSQVRIWAIDPAREHIEDFMQYVRQRYPRSVFALGHSHATAAQCRRVAKYGVKVQTHHTDAGKAPGRAQGTPGAGCDEYTLYNPDMYAELICDQTGVHVVPDLIKLAVRTKGVEKICLITDSIADAPYPNNAEEGVWYGPDLVYDEEGHLNGSKLTLDGACRNLMTHTGYGLCHAIRMATINPARLLGIDDQVGSLEVGKKANLILIDDMVHVKQVILEGQDAVIDGNMII